MTSKQTLGSHQQAWIAALKSGDYSKAMGCLWRQSTDCYCCLGVACKVMGITPYGEHKMWGEYKEGLLPDPIIAYFKMTPLAYSFDGPLDLAHLNDSTGVEAGFAPIWEEIEANPHLYFTEPA